MGMKPIRRLKMPVEKYQKGGEEKTRFIEVGTLFHNEDEDRYAVKMLDLTGKCESYWVACYEIDYGDGPRQSRPKSKPKTRDEDEEEYQEIPF